MAATHSDEFKRDAVRIALTSGLTRRQVAYDLGIGLSTLGKWVRAVSEEVKVPAQDAELLRENERLRKENRILREEEGGAKKLFRAAARLCAVVTACAMLHPKGSCRSLIGGSDPVKKRGTWVDAHLRVVTPSLR
jgi:transposase